MTRDATVPPRTEPPWMDFPRTESSRTESLDADDAGIARAASLLRAGRLVAFGTETVYGLGADATDPAAVAALYAAKRRPARNPLICHFADAEAAWPHVRADARARALAEALWPGSLTLVLPRRTTSPIVAEASAGLPTLAVRVPAPEVARTLLAAAAVPVVAPSANRSGRVSPTRAAHVLDELGGAIDAVLDSGPCPVGVESTVLDLSGDTPRLLRHGAVGEDEIAALIGPVASGTGAADGAGAAGALASPGLLASHYAPHLPVRRNAVAAEPGEALLAFGTAPHGAALVWNLSVRGSLPEAAARLYAGLRWLDEEGQRLGLRGIAAMAVPEESIGRAINDRLRRAAAPRPGEAGR